MKFEHLSNPHSDTPLNHQIHETVRINSNDARVHCFEALYPVKGHLNTLPEFPGPLKPAKAMLDQMAESAHSSVKRCTN